jgi:2,4-dienoyl-CoA reductase-like NADH-dependent reductase (Old Yellow Enzyme family)
LDIVLDQLLKPFQLRHLSLRNRIMSTAHTPSYQEGGHPRDRYRLYHEEKARGGVALTMIGGSTNIAPDSPSIMGQLYAGDDSVIPWFRRLTDGVHAHGAAIMCQLTHMGRRTAWDDGHWLPVVGPAGTRERAHRAFPKPIEREDMQRITGQFAKAALRVQAGGFDGLEMLSHSHLLGQFLSPLVNRRGDDYGGSLENRMRFPLEVISAVREEVGPDFILGLRITGDELVDGGLTGEECVEIARRLAATGKVDFLNVLAGAPYDDLGLAGWIPPMGMPAAPHLSIAGQIRAAVSVPVFHAGGIADIATARHAITAGLVDMVGMTRAQMADPWLVEKLQSGQEQRIRPCVGLGYCVDRVNQGKPAVCGHNAATGREATMTHRFATAAHRRKLVVVGGGPGGMEAARVGAERGHEVVLFEASDRLGGQLNLAAKAMTRRQIRGIADWLISELTHLGVDVRLNHYAETADILAEQPDAVILATGGWPELPDLPGSAMLVSSWQVLGGEARVTGDVLLIDEPGDQAGGVCADFMARAGCSVTIVSPDRAIAHDLGPTNAAVVLRDLARQGVALECFQELVSVAETGNRRRATLRHVLTGQLTERMVDHIVIENGTMPLEDLYFDLKPLSKNHGQLDHDALIAGTYPFANIDGRHGFVLARIGDAVASRNIHAAIFDAMRVAKEI